VDSCCEPLLFTLQQQATSLAHRVALASGDVEGALKEGNEVIKAYSALLGASHPMTALQQYTQGQLLCQTVEEGMPVGLEMLKRAEQV